MAKDIGCCLNVYRYLNALIFDEMCHKVESVWHNFMRHDIYTILKKEIIC